MRLPAALLALAVLAGSAAPSDEAPFRRVGNVGPNDASFPFSITFSPDAKWIAFADGHLPYLEVYAVDGWKRAWPTESGGRAGSTHAIAFSTDSKRLYAVYHDALVPVVLRDGAWTRGDPVPLAMEFVISMVDSPQPMSAGPDPTSPEARQDVDRVVFANGKELLTVAMPSRKVERRALGEKGGFARLLPDGTLAVSDRTTNRTGFERPPAEPREVEGLLVAVAPKGDRFLYATSWPEPEEPIALELRDAAGKVLAAFRVGTPEESVHKAPHRALLQAVFSPDGSFLVTVESRGDVVVRDATTAKPVQRIAEFPGYPMGVAFSPDSTMLLVAGRNREPEKPQGIVLWRREAAPPK